MQHRVTERHAHSREDYYYECDSMEEYNKIIERKKQLAESYPYTYSFWEGGIHGRHYFTGFGWAGNDFDGEGFTFTQKYAGDSIDNYHYMKPGTYKIIKYHKPTESWNCFNS